MVAHLVGLKIRLLRNSLRREPWRIVAAVLGGLWALGMLSVVVLGLVALRLADVDTAGAVVTTGGALLLLAWALVPVLAFGVDATVDPQRFAPFGLTARQLVPGLLLGGLVGVPGAATAVAALATVVTWSRDLATLTVAALAAAVGVLTCVAASRATTTLASRLFSRRRSREVVTSLVAVALMAIGPAVGFLSNSVTVSIGGDIGQRFRGVADLLGWTPLGWAWSAPQAVADGHPVTGLAKLVLAVLLLVGVCAIWERALASALVNPPSGGGTRRHSAVSVIDRLPATPFGAVAARCLRYWRRDPRYLTSVVATLVLPVLLIAISVTGVLSLGTALLMLGPVVGGVLGWGQHNDVAYDGTAVWLHLATGLPGSADRLGRAVAVLIWGVPLTVLAAVLGCGVADRWALLPAVLGLSLGLLGAGTGVSAVTSAVLPYAVPEPGANPFSTPSGAAVATIVAQLVTSFATTVVAAPVFVAFLFALRGGTTSAGLTLLLGLAVAVAAGAGGIRLGGRLFERRGPALLLALR